MSNLFLKIALYLFCVLIGFSVFALFANVMIAIDGFPKMDDENAFALFRSQLLQGSLTCWLIGSVSGLFYFWIKSGWKYFFLGTTVLFPLFYCIIFTLQH